MELQVKVFYLPCLLVIADLVTEDFYTLDVPVPIWESYPSSVLPNFSIQKYFPGMNSAIKLFIIFKNVSLYQLWMGCLQFHWMSHSSLVLRQGCTHVHSLPFMALFTSIRPLLIEVPAKLIPLILIIFLLYSLSVPNNFHCFFLRLLQFPLYLELTHYSKWVCNGIFLVIVTAGCPFPSIVGSFHPAEEEKA